jgi:alkylation response protein AidB-like acyl-CoA dehydrogenase
MLQFLTEPAFLNLLRFERLINDMPPTQAVEDRHMNFQEAEHLQQIRETMRRFVNEAMPRELAREWDREDRWPQDVFARLVELGVTGLTFSEAYGGHGRDIPATLLVIEELARRSMAVANPYIMAACYAGMNVFESGSEAQRRELLPLVAEGKLLFAYGLTEPDVGADLASVKTRAAIEGDELVINGTKRFCTGARYADYIYTLVRSDPQLPRYRNLSIVLVPRESRGIEIASIDATAQRGVGTTDVIFEEVRVPLDNVLGGAEQLHKGWSVLAGPTLDVEKLEVAAMALGNAEGALQDAWDYSEQRRQFGKAISGHQAIRHKLAQCRTQMLAARLMLYHAADLANRNQPCGVETSMAKLFVCQEAQEVVLACQRIMGAYGCVAEYDMERHVRESLVFPIAGGSTEIQLNNIANRLQLARE